MAALVMEDVRKVYRSGDDEVVALDHATLTVGDDEMVTLLGPSGSGKSTLLSIAGGLLTPTEGRVVVGETEVSALEPKRLTEFRQDEFFELSATAENFAGLDLPIQWRRAQGANINEVPSYEPVIVGELEPGRHVFQAWAVDVLGVPGMATVEIVVKNNPPQLSITSPAANTVPIAATIMKNQ